MSQRLALAIGVGAAVFISSCSGGAGGGQDLRPSQPGSLVGATTVRTEPSSERCENFGPIQGVPDPGYCAATEEMKSAYRDCLIAADEVAYTVPPGSDEFWMLARQSWNLSSPDDYSKKDENLWACLLAYQVVTEEFPGPYS